jgi:polyhydroxybutyrate depolymerase
MLTMYIILPAIIVILLILIYFYFIYAPAPIKMESSGTLTSSALTRDGHQRSYVSYVPKQVKKNPELIVALHGTGMNATKMRQWTGYNLETMADQYGFIVIYPDGYKGNWNDCRKNSLYPASKAHIDDVGFIETMVSSAASTYAIDTKKVFVFGFSNGGNMAFRLAIEKPQLIAAVCAIGSNLPTVETLNCKSEGTTSRVMLVSGTGDPINPYSGGKVSLFGLKQIGTCMSAVATAEYFLSTNNVKNTPEVINLENTNTKRAFPVEVQSWRSAGKAFVKLYSIKAGGHVIPQPYYRFPRLMGKTAANFDATVKAVEFFQIMDSAHLINQNARL